MKNDKLVQYVTRDSILKLLTDDEVASVSTAETAATLVENDEYLDLTQLSQGIQRAHRTTAMGSVLPRKSVQEATWNKILAQLQARRNAPPSMG